MVKRDSLRNKVDHQLVNKGQPLRRQNGTEKQRSKDRKEYNVP